MCSVHEESQVESLYAQSIDSKYLNCYEWYTRTEKVDESL